jgi:hypothetical protein
MNRTQTHLENSLNSQYWREINPGLAIEGKTIGDAANPMNLEKDVLEDLQASLMEEGYFQTCPILPMAEILSLREGVERIKQAGWFPVFAFVYDEFWVIRRRLSSILSETLGPEYRQLPDFWAWYLDRNSTSHGWKPHRDRPVNAVREDGTPNTLTMWIALTDATPLNGCMYVLPASFDRECEVWFKALIENIQGIRALPAGAGSIIGWKQNLLHWGGRSCEKARHPRISLGFEFQRGDAQPYNDQLLDPIALPTFDQRLSLIGTQILQYLPFINQDGNLPDEVVQFAKELKRCVAGPNMTSTRPAEITAQV